jgi:sugar (pentulose or hexulose) kinase
MHGMVALDQDNQGCAPRFYGNDVRTQAQCDQITQAAGGLEALLGYTTTHAARLYRRQTWVSKTSRKITQNKTGGQSKGLYSFSVDRRIGYRGQRRFRAGFLM